MLQGELGSLIYILRFLSFKKSLKIVFYSIFKIEIVLYKGEGGRKAYGEYLDLINLSRLFVFGFILSLLRTFSATTTRSVSPYFRTLFIHVPSALRI